MRPSTARALVRLYPARWRQRYGAELEALLEDCPMDLRFLFDTVGGGISERARVAASAVGAMVAAFVGVTVCAFLVQFIALLAVQLAATLLGRPLQFSVGVGPAQLWAAGGPLWVGFGNGAALLAFATGLFAAGVAAGRAGRQSSRLN